MPPEEEKDVVDVPETQPETPETPEEPQDDVVEPEDVEQPEVDPEKEDLKKKLAESEKQRKQLYERVKKTEPLKEGLSAKDALLLSKAEVDIDDVDEVVDFAKYKKLTIADALKSPTLRAILNERAEERKSARAAQTRSGRTQVVTSPEMLVDRARQGKLPESDAGIQALVDAELAAKKK